MSFEDILEFCEKVESYGLKEIQFVLEKGRSSVIKGFGRGRLACVATNGNRVFWYDVKKVKKTILEMMNGPLPPPTNTKEEK